MKTYLVLPIFAVIRAAAVVFPAILQLLEVLLQQLLLPLIHICSHPPPPLPLPTSHQRCHMHLRHHSLDSRATPPPSIHAVTAAPDMQGTALGFLGFLTHPYARSLAFIQKGLDKLHKAHQECNTAK